jgi:hypothetical protein
MAVMRRSTFAAVAHAVIVVVCSNNQCYRNRQEYQFIHIGKLLEHQKNKTGRKQQEWIFVVVMPAVTMVKRVATHGKGQGNHTPFKIGIADDINAKYRQTGEHYRQQGTVNGTCNRCDDAQRIPIQFYYFHLQGSKCNKKINNNCILVAFVVGFTVLLQLIMPIKANFTKIWHRCAGNF